MRRNAHLHRRSRRPRLLAAAGIACVGVCVFGSGLAGARGPDPRHLADDAIWDFEVEDDEESRPSGPAALPLAPPAAPPPRPSSRERAPARERAPKARASAPTPAPAPSGTADPLPGPEPFADTAPLLPELHRLLAEKAPAKRSLQAGLKALEDWLDRPQRDVIAGATGRWLRARLLLALDRRRDGIDALNELAKDGGPFADEARLELARLAPGKKGETEARAEWLLTRSPGAPGYLEGVDEALAILKTLKKTGRAIELTEQILRQSMGPVLHSRLLVRLSALHLDKGFKDTARAIALLRSFFWSNRHAPSSSLVRALKSLKSAPGDDEELLRQAIHGGRIGCAKVARLLAKQRRPKRTAAWVAAVALSDRWTDPEGALKALLTYGKRRGEDAKAPEIALAHGMLLRRMDRDDEAVEVLTSLIEAAPRHALAAEARDQVSIVLRRLGRSAEADAMDEDLLALGIAGTYHRDALWRLGFGAIERSESSLAERWLEELERRYGSEPDRHSFSWYERARYWRGRAHAMAGREGEARRLWQGLIARYPAGWYALLARTRIGEEVETANWAVAPDDPMATALGWYRLGAEREALEAFECLQGAYRLPGNGRKLLSDLLLVHGDTDKAERILRFASIPPTMPGDDPAEIYYTWYPMPYAEELAEAAAGAAIPKHFLAGVVSVETRFNPKRKSSVGAMGLAQLMPSTGGTIGRRIFGDTFKNAQLWDPATNLTIASHYLQDLLARFDGHPALAAAAYNAGPTPVKRWLVERGELELDAWVETIPYEEARRYVMRVLSDAEIYRRLYRLEPLPMKLPLSFSESVSARNRRGR